MGRLYCVDISFNVDITQVLFYQVIQNLVRGFQTFYRNLALLFLNLQFIGSNSLHLRLDKN